MKSRSAPPLRYGLPACFLASSAVSTSKAARNEVEKLHPTFYELTAKLVKLR